jgi:hypothetical protein
MGHFVMAYDLWEGVLGRHQVEPLFLPEGESPATGILQQVVSSIFADFDDFTICIFDILSSTSIPNYNMESATMGICPLGYPFAHATLEAASFRAPHNR